VETEQKKSKEVKEEVCSLALFALIRGLFALLALFALNIFVFSFSNVQIYIYLVLNAKIFSDFK